MTAEAQGILRSAGICAAAATLTAAIVAAAVAWSGRREDVRQSLHFSFAGVGRSPAEVVDVALHNGRFAAGAIVLALIAPRLESLTRRAATVLLAVLLSANAAAVGIAVGAYGLRLLTAIAPHLPLELGGLCLAGGSSLQALREPLRWRTVATVAAGSAASLIAAATLETYVSARWSR